MNLKLKKSNLQKNDLDRENFYQTFIDDMESSAINIEINNKDIELANKKYKSFKRKRSIFYAALISFFVILMVSAFYNVFLKQGYSPQEIAMIANYYNQKTNFPEAGVEGYISLNIRKLLENKTFYEGRKEDYNFKNIHITRINSKNDFIAHVYFDLDVVSPLGEQFLSCMLPLYYDFTLNKYYPCGELMITPLDTTATDIEIKENPLMSFEGIEKENEENTKSSEVFVKNFFNMFYSNQDITPYYNGKKLIPGNLKFNNMTEYVLYARPNKNGYNATCKISLTTENGITYITVKYISIYRSGNSWIINGVL